MRVAIVGGGLAGLCAGRDLAKAGHQVTIYEKYPNFGGLASAFDVAGTKLERFYHHVFSTDLDLLNLLDELGLQGGLRWHKDDNGSYCQGIIFPMAPAWRILLMPVLSPLDRLRLAFVSKWLSLKKDHRPMEAVTSKEYIIRTMGRRVWEVQWEPLFKAKFGAHADRISLTWFFGRLKARFGPSKEGAPTGHLGYLMGSTQVIVDALERELKAAGARLLSSHPVQKLLVEDGKVTGLRTKDGDEAFDQVLVTCATPLFLELAGEALEPQQRASLEEFKYHGSVVAVLELSQSVSPHYWLSILDTSLPFLAVIEHTRMIGPENYQGRHILYLAKYLDTAEPFFKLGKDAVLKEFYAQLKRVLPAFHEGMVLNAHVMRADYTQPIVTTGYGPRIPGHRLGPKGLYLANMTQIYPEDRGMSYSVGLGRKVAKLMLEDAV